MTAIFEETRIHTSDLFPVLLPLLEEGHFAVFTVTGMSMWPFLCHGRDQVVVAACDPASLRVGDIILFQTPPGRYLLHRISALQPGMFETTGDGNCFRDGWYSLDSVKARVVRFVRKGTSIRCRNLWWRFLARVWEWLFPVRGTLLRRLRKVGRLRRAIVRLRRTILRRRKVGQQLSRTDRMQRRLGGGCGRSGG